MATKATIIIDTREQQPYSFNPERAAVVLKKLHAGDYSIAGMENVITVERKSLDDFVSTVIKGWKRFNKELLRMQEYEASCIVVEGSMQDIFLKKYTSGAHPNSVFGRVMSIICDFRIPVYFCSNRQIACKFTEEYLCRFYSDNKHHPK